ncbi:MAG: hypothetical protein ABIP66_07775, partial [Gemmatimonadaceae bacterium]
MPAFAYARGRRERWGSWVVILLAGTLSATSQLVAQADRQPAAIDQILSLRAVSDVEVSPDGRWISYTVTTRDRQTNRNQSAIWLVSADGGTPLQLTRGPIADRGGRWAPDGSYIAFLSDRDSLRKSQVYGIDPRGGEAWRITRGETAVSAFRMSPDGSRIAYIAPAKASKADEELEKLRGRPLVRDSAYASDWNHLLVAPLKRGMAHEGQRTSPEGLDVTGVEWGPDSRQIAWSGKPGPTLRSSSEGAVYVQDAVGSEARKMTRMPGNETVAAWTPEAGLLVYGTGQLLGTYNRRIWSVPLAGGEPVSLTDALDEDANFIHSTSDALIVEAAKKTKRGLFRIPLASGRAAGVPQALTDDTRFYSDFSWSASGERIAFVGESASEPPDVYTSPAGSFAPRRLTNTNPDAHAIAFGEQKVVTWKSAADGEAIEGVLNLPVGYSAGSRVPLLLIIHGGPSGVSSDRFPSTRGAYPIAVF